MKHIVSILIFLALAASAPALTFEAWIATFPTIADASPEADPDGDGVENLLEYALAGMDPTTLDQQWRLPEQVFGLRAANTALPLEDLSVIVFDGQNVPKEGSYYVGLRYKPRAGTEGIMWLPEYSWWTMNLDAWLNGRGAFLPATTPDSQGRVIRYMAGMFEAEHTPPKLFLRMRVVKQ